VINQISTLSGKDWKISAETWNLDSMRGGEAIRKMIARDAGEADVFIVAMSSLDRREAELVAWLDSLTAERLDRRTAGLFIGLLGDETGRAGELDWTVKQFLRCARHLDRDFIWHWMESDAVDGDDWLAGSIETVLARKCPAPDGTFLHEAAMAVAG